MTYTTGQLATYVSGTLIGNSDVQCLGATIDSRECEQGNVFFALEGENVDGHAFIENAIEMGCSAVVTKQKIETSVPAVQVPDVRKSLFELAMARRAQLPVQNVIAITGSVGKTTTKNIIAELLGPRAVASKKSFNNDLGVPLTILAAEQAEYIVAEVGANDVGEIEPLAALVQPDIGILTSIEKAHLEGFGTKDVVLQEKAKLLEALPSHGFAIVPDWIELTNFDIKATICRIGTSEEADVHLKTGLDSDGFASISIDGHVEPLSMLGEHNAWNCAFGIVACLKACQDTSMQSLMRTVSSIPPPEGRMQLKEVNGVTFIDDSYNANPASMVAALDLFSTLEARRKVLILGDMLELGEHAHAEHRSLAQAIAQANADLTILVGSNMNAVSQSIPCIYEPDSSPEALERITSLLKNGDSVLLKGSRALRLERILELAQHTKVSSQ